MSTKPLQTLDMPVEAHPLLLGLALLLRKKKNGVKFRQREMDDMPDGMSVRVDIYGEESDPESIVRLSVVEPT